MAQAQAQPRFLDANRRHAATIRAVLTDFLAHPELDAPPVDNGAVPDVGRSGRVEYLQMPDGRSSNFVSIADILASSNRQRDRVVSLPSFVTEKTNRSRLVAKYVLKHLDELLLGTPARTTNFELLASQRLAVLVMTTPLPRESYVELNITRDAMNGLTGSGARKQGFDVRMALPAGSLPVLSLADFSTGAPLLERRVTL
tara:strand:+ start:51 stop:650 length:600 start_codon:yes stop_codon:yes gene_type:complete